MKHHLRPAALHCTKNRMSGEYEIQLCGYTLKDEDGGGKSTLHFEGGRVYTGQCPGSAI